MQPSGDYDFLESVPPEVVKAQIAQLEQRIGILKESIAALQKRREAILKMLKHRDEWDGVLPGLLDYYVVVQEETELAIRVQTGDLIAHREQVEKLAEMIRGVIFKPGGIVRATS